MRLETAMSGDLFKFEKQRFISWTYLRQVSGRFLLPKSASLTDTRVLVKRVRHQRLTEIASGNRVLAAGKTRTARFRATSRLRLRWIDGEVDSFPHGLAGQLERYS